MLCDPVRMAVADSDGFEYKLRLLLSQCKEEKVMYRSALPDVKRQPSEGHVYEKRGDFEVSSESLSLVLTLYGTLLPVE